MKEKAIGFFQELQSNGKIAYSVIRLITLLLVVSSIVYLFERLHAEWVATQYLWELMKNHVVDNPTYLVMKSEIPHVDWAVFSTMLGMGITGKVAQKFGEAQPTETTTQPPTP